MENLFCAMENRIKMHFRILEMMSWSDYEFAFSGRSLSYVIFFNPPPS